ncbi:hypothetical protein PROFUN_14970 [Planoprotostelium fungivorum]|uniref:Mannose-P-dolichol utilization defect 1 protein homolog n=1 Tax=Planoprotostelium fungivorum TaxID=1890364 RepID=A0A2P6MY54_9EUKA|nr:hypothetical protein PROFUN_14970 [Planoprotostelium fungivorum]
MLLADTKRNTTLKAHPQAPVSHAIVACSEHTKAYKCFAENLQTDHRRQAFTTSSLKRTRMSAKISGGKLQKYIHTADFISYYATFTYATDQKCFSELLSKALSYAIILGALILKVPQIIKIVNAKSGEGLSVVSHVVELVGGLLTIVYSFRKDYAFSTYGEVILPVRLCISPSTDLIIIFLIYRYSSSSLAPAVLITAAYFGLGYVLMAEELIPISTLTAIQSGLNIPLLFLARVPQIYTIFKNGTAGQLAIITWILNLAGSTARVFTTFKETGDLLLTAAYALGAFFNFVIILQILWYGNKPAAQKKKKTN